MTTLTGIVVLGGVIALFVLEVLTTSLSCEEIRYTYSYVSFIKGFFSGLVLVTKTKNNNTKNQTNKNNLLEAMHIYHLPEKLKKSNFEGGNWVYLLLGLSVGMYVLFPCL